MPKRTIPKTSTRNKPRGASAPVVISMGCPCGVGPEVSLAAALSPGTPSSIIVGDRGALLDAARALGLAPTRVAKFNNYDPDEGAFSGVRLVESTSLSRAERPWGKPTAAAGQAQLLYIEEAYRIAQRSGLAICTAPVSKTVIAHSGLRRARSFRGHTEWLEALDGAAHSVMCFASSQLVTSLVTTHIPVRKIPRAITPALVAKASLELADLLIRLGVNHPKIAVASLNPHAGEESLLGGEERSAIVPGITLAAQVAGRKARFLGPVGAETAYRKGASGVYDGVVAMYHDQATIPMKLLDFGGAVNVTQGLSVVRTSVDHGTAYDIAGKGIAEARGMREAMKMAAQLGASPRKIPHGAW